jgi:hypothetical protein
MIDTKPSERADDLPACQGLVVRPDGEVLGPERPEAKV